MKKDNATTLENLPATLTIAQLCKELAIGRTKAWQLIKAGHIRAIPIGKRGRRIPKSELVRFIGEGLEE